jgi:hypothetical protein
VHIAATPTFSFAAVRVERTSLQQTDGRMLQKVIARWPAGQCRQPHQTLDEGRYMTFWFREVLACGHTLITHPQTDGERPGLALRRNCHECDGRSAPKKPSHKVVEMPRRQAQAAAMPAKSSHIKPTSGTRRQYEREVGVD